MTSIDLDYCRDVTRRSGSSFGTAFRWLPGPRRDALYAVYAFCRAVDDAVDETEPELGRVLLEAWRLELDRCYAGRPTHPISIALSGALERFPIPRAALAEVIDGVEMDLEPRAYETFADLEIYCRKVASAVGRASIEVFGYRSPRTRDYADVLGLALQVTNIIRDVGEDADRGRVYLPSEDLDRFGVTREGILSRAWSPKLRDLLEAEAIRARELFSRAEALLPPEDEASLRPAELMRSAYARLLDRIEAAEYRVLDQRIRLGRLDKIRLAGSLWLRSIAA